MVGGAPTVHVTGIGFNATDLKRMIDQQVGSEVTMPIAQAAEAAASTASASDSTVLFDPGARTGLIANGIKPGALVATVAETMAALSCGKTTVYKLLNQRKLERAPSKAGTRITADSVRRYAGLIT